MAVRVLLRSIFYEKKRSRLKRYDNCVGAAAAVLLLPPVQLPPVLLLPLPVMRGNLPQAKVYHTSTSINWLVFKSNKLSVRTNTSRHYSSTTAVDVRAATAAQQLSNNEQRHLQRRLIYRYGLLRTPKQVLL